MYKSNVTLRYVTCRYLSLRCVTKRYVTDTTWGSFHDTCKRGHYRRYPRMQHGWSDEVSILCDDIVSYLVPAKFHTGPNPHDIDAVRVRSPEKLNCFTL